MLLGYKINAIHVSATTPANRTMPRARCSLSASTKSEDYIAKIKNRLFHRELEISPSSYDTAWVAMVPSREYSGGGKPCFPQCLDWIMENQNPDGSWGLQMDNNQHLIKDSLSCTLACLLALRKWDVGHQIVHKGLKFIGLNQWAARDPAQYTPIGFDVVFPEMVNYAKQLDLTLPLDPILNDNMLQWRDSKIKRLKEKQNLEYVAEGLGASCDWNRLLSRQRSNGSLFNSPATTAAALLHSYDDKCFEYLQSVVKHSNNGVPTIYPLGIYTRLSIIDTLESLGIDRYFQLELDNILDETYRLWHHKEEEIFDDITCRAMAFRLLRAKGYQVSSDELANFGDEEQFFNTVSIQYTGVTTVLELNRASKFKIFEEEVVLEKIHGWTSKFLKQQLLNETIFDKRLRKQVECALRNFGSMLDRVENKVNIELYDIDHVEISKTAYRCPTIHNEDILLFSRHDFNVCQAQYQKELQQLERWYKDSKLDKSKFGREVVSFSNFQAAALLPHLELSEARMCLSQAVVLSVRLDDLFDCHASQTQALKFIESVKKWSEPSAKRYDVCGEDEIIYAAFYNTLNEWAKNASIKQGRSIKHTLIALWLEVLMYYMREKELASTKERGITMDEYLSITWVTAAVKSCVETSAHFLGVELAHDMLLSAECTSLYKHASTITRLLNDVHTYEREKEEEQQINAISLLVDESHSMENAISKVQQTIEQEKIKLLQMVLSPANRSMVPKVYKDFIWKSCKLAYYIYAQGDGFDSPVNIMDDMKALIHDPLLT